MTIEVLPQSPANVSPAYQHLFTLDPKLVKEISKKNIDLIFLDFTAAEGQLRVQNKRLSYEMRTIGQDDLVKRVNEKLAEYDRIGSVAWPALSGVIAVAGAFSGAGTAIFLVSQAGSQVATSTGQHFDSMSKGRIDSADHLYQTTSGLNQERTQAMREEDQQFDRSLSAVERAMQALQKGFDSLNGV